MFVKPTNDPSRAIVRDPITKQILPADGKEVDDNDFHWLRAIQRGDVVVVKSKNSTQSTYSAPIIPSE